MHVYSLHWMQRICLTLLAFVFAATASADDWPQWLGPQRDGVWREKGLLKEFSDKGPKYLWRAPVGMGYAGPAVADGKVYITDRQLAAGEKNPDNPFGKSKTPGTERVLCLDEKTGKQLWKYEYDCPYQVSYAAGPRTTPAVDGDRVYTLGTMGDLVCLDTKNGELIWSKKLTKEYDCDVPTWGFSSHPLVDGDRVYCLVGGEGSLVVCFDKMTGKEIWKNLSAPEPGYAPLVIFDIAGKRQLIAWHPVGIHSLEPETGKINWYHRFPKKGSLKAGMSIPTPRYKDNRLFVSCFYNGSCMLKLDDKGGNPTVLWEDTRVIELPDQTTGLHCVMATPFLLHDHIYGVCSYGELRCLEQDTGNRLWMTREPTTGGKPTRWGNAFMVQHEEKFYLFNEGGELVIAQIAPKGYQEWSRAKILEPTNKDVNSKSFGPNQRPVLWSHPAFANRCMFVRNDKEIVRVSLAAEDGK
jgi:outer membrane protein assembly factor BamB